MEEKREKNNEVDNEEVRHTFDISKMDLTNKIDSVHQEGNFLVMTTDRGVTFRQHIGPGKVLCKENGKFKLKEIVPED